MCNCSVLSASPPYYNGGGGGGNGHHGDSPPFRATVTNSMGQAGAGPSAADRIDVHLMPQVKPSALLSSSSGTESNHTLCTRGHNHNSQMPIRSNHATLVVHTIFPWPSSNACFSSVGDELELG